MFLSVAAVLATALLGSVFGQTSTTATSSTVPSSATGTSTSTAPGATHTCLVGEVSSRVPVVEIISTV